MSETNPLLGLNLEALTKLRDDTLRRNRAHIRDQKITASHLAVLHEAIRIREAQEKPDEVIVTDHALVRWLERIEGLDLEPYRAEIRRVVNSHPVDPTADSNVCADDQTPAVVVTRRDRTAVTVLHQDGVLPEPGQLSVMKGLAEID